jgi:hypothetical protein
VAEALTAIRLRDDRHLTSVSHANVLAVRAVRRLWARIQWRLSTVVKSPSLANTNAASLMILDKAAHLTSRTEHLNDSSPPIHKLRSLQIEAAQHGQLSILLDDGF